NPRNRVSSFDVVNVRSLRSEASIPNVQFFIGDCLRSADLLNSALIFLDTSPHDGRFERQVYDTLQTHGYRGLLVLDDINCDRFPGMNHFWLAIECPKWDITRYGHHSGTGVVSFGDTEFRLD